MAMQKRILADGQAVMYLGDCLDIIPTLPKGSFGAVITDPPFDSYRKLDPEFDTIRLLREITLEEMLARCQKAMDEGVLIDLEKEYGISPMPEGMLS